MIITTTSIILCGLIFVLYCMSYSTQHVIDSLHLNWLTKNYKKKAMEYSKEEAEDRLKNIMDDYFAGKSKTYTSESFVRNGYGVRFTSAQYTKDTVQRLMTIVSNDFMGEEIFRIRLGYTTQGKLFKFITGIKVSDKYEYMVKKTNKVPSLYGHTALYGDKDYESEEGSRFNYGITEKNFLDLILRRIL